MRRGKIKWEKELVSERWKYIPGYKGMYEVSDQGRVRSLSRYIFRRDRNGELHSVYRTAKLLTPKTRGDYKYVFLYNPSGREAISIHRIVALAFLGYSNKSVNHIDEDKFNNRLDNLEWVTLSENQWHSRAKSFTLQHKDGRVRQFRGCAKAAKRLSISKSSLWRLLSGKNPEVKGWRVVISDV